MVIRIGLIGARGQLGRAIGALASQDAVFCCTREFQKGDCLLEGDFDVYIDASLSSALENNLSAARRRKLPIVVGTTGLSEENWQLLEETAREIPLFYSPNFSLGFFLLTQCAELIAPHFSNIHLIETHHVHKKDSPSGSARLLAQLIESTAKKTTRIESIRAGDTIGKHELHFRNPTEQLSLTHSIESREVFAQGALAAARFLSAQPPGFYGMENLASATLVEKI